MNERERFKLELYKTEDYMKAALTDLTLEITNASIPAPDLQRITERIDSIKIDVSNRLKHILDITVSSIENGNTEYNPDNAFLRDSRGITQVYTDGSSFKTTTTKNYSGYGIAWNLNHPLNKAEPTPTKNHSNNAAEIAAVLMAIMQAKSIGLNQLCVHTDSRYVKDVIDNKLDLWNQFNFMDNDGFPRPNTPLWRRLHKEMTRDNFQLETVWVKAHNKHKLNDKADHLAKLGAERCRKQLAETARQRI